MKVIALFLCILISSCTQYTQKDLTNIKKVAIVNGMEDKLLFFNRGLTIFENSENRVDISNWQLADSIVPQVAKVARENYPDVEFFIIDKSKYNFKNNYESVVELSNQMKNEGYDTLLLIRSTGAYDAGSNLRLIDSNAGFLFLQLSIFGNQLRAFICAQYQLQLIKTDGNKLLKAAGNGDINGRSPSGLKLKPFDQYSPDELDIIKNSLADHINATINKNTIEVFTPTPEVE